MSLDNPPPNPLGDQIRSAREARGWSQIELAQQVGVTNRTIGEWERGARVPKKHIGRIEKILGITLRDTKTELGEFTDPQLTAEITARLASRDERIRNLEQRVAALEERLRAAGIDPATDDDGEGP